MPCSISAAGGGGGSKKWGLGMTSALDGGCWEDGGDFFQGVAVFTTTKKLKSEIFNDKKV